MRDHYLTLAREHRYEPDKIRGSRFIATAAPAASTAEAEALLERVRAEFSDARHVCWAWRVGADGEQTRSSDDGEPAGSAGRPILLQLEGHGVTQVVAAVARYFGGVKLGVGGLMRAYGGAAGQCLDRARVTRVEVTSALRIEHPYDCSGAVQGLLSAEGLVQAGAEYGELVRFTVHVPIRSLERFQRELADRTAGRARVWL